MKIVSFLPSATEILYALKLGRNLRGVSHECDFPPQVLGKPVVMHAAISTLGRFPNRPQKQAGRFEKRPYLSDRQIDRRVRAALRSGKGLYRINRPLLEAIKPDLIVTQKLCDVCAISADAVQEAIHSFSPKPRVLSLHPHSLEGVFDDILKIGEVTGKRGWARRYVAGLRRRVEAVRRRARKVPRPRVFSMEWCDPIMNAGHWIPEMVSISGGAEGLSDKGKPSVRVSWEKVRRYQPEILFVMPCGFSAEGAAKRAQRLCSLPGWAALPAVRRRKVYCLNGSAYYNRPGPRLVEGLEIMARLIHPEFTSLPLKQHAVICL